MENSALRTELINELIDAAIGIIEDEMLRKFEELCAAYSMEPPEIVCEWVAFTANKGMEHIKPTSEAVCQFERECLSKKLTKTPVRKMKSLPTSKNRKSIQKETTESTVLVNYTPEQFSRKRQLTPETPPNAGHFPGLHSSSMKYGCRTSKGDVVCHWGETGSCSWMSSGSHSVEVRHYDTEQALTNRYQFMFEKIKHRADILNDILEDLACVFKCKYEIDEWNHFCHPSPNELTVVGRICSDSNSKLHPSSIILEGSRETCSGQTIHLDVSKLSNCAFFPGQVIAGKGRNILGKALLMSSLFEPLYLPFLEKVPFCETESLQLVIAAGPFTTVDNLSFDPLTDLLKYVTDNKPHVCILIGPFVDSRQEFEKNIMEEELSVIYTNLFSCIEEAGRKSGTNFVIVSSCNDILQDYIYPTPPYSCTNKDIQKLLFVSDPSILSVDGIVIAVTATDIVFHLSKEEIALPGGTDRLGRLAQHILAQHSFYPLYPPNEAINIDYEQFEMYAKLPVTPHVLILPSDLRCFMKNINGCLCINPERLTKGAGGGNFVRIQIDIGSCSNAYDGPIVDNMKGEIVKI